MQAQKPLLSLLLILLLLASCACPKNVFVLLPDSDGSVGAIELTNEKGSVLVDKAGEGLTVAGPDSPPLSAKPMSQAKIEQIFKAALAAEPLPSESFLLYFESGSTSLTARSRELIPQIIASIKVRESADVSVIGHTDRAGSKLYNLKLSSRRAENIRDLLVEQGVNPECLQVSSHGEGNPLVATSDNVAEPKNRRVEVVVR